MSNCSDKSIDFQTEIDILKDLDHHGIVKAHEAGDDGTLINTNHKVSYDIPYIVLDYEKKEFFDFCISMGAMGEEAGKFFLHQLIDSLQYIHDKNIGHRDLKLDNMLIDSKLNIKILDFGLACKDETEAR